MRSLRTLIIATGLLFLAAGAAADPVAAPGYRLETVSKPGAAFSGLSRDGEALLVTDLASGRLYRREANGEFVAFGPVFPHGLDVIGDPTGPYRVVRVGDAFVVAQGWTPVDAGEGPLDHALVAVGKDGGPRVISSDFWNPFDFAIANGTYYVIDSARNSVERMQADGQKQTIMTFRRMKQETTALRQLSPTEFTEGSDYEVDAVPTGIALRDGRIHVALFGGFPFLDGAGKVVSAPETGGVAPPRVDVEGLNAPVAITFDADGGMLVLEHGRYGQKEGFLKGSGRLLKLDKTTGARQTILDGLTRPVSVLVWDERRLVVSELAGNLHFLTRESTP
ncbi:ScyD/ScyE family protein [Sinorhizobium garamanticum]|uniref:ScyD/ScyE family protein n=1 Tax=Sinorhizobium garamanticum TaxID=680247 RepID=A0ABY8DIV3_9HYPH|nr:ScyD/ScyE family protein [Sinorhizobium garamanticum]WEX90826.1 ScyD/ScyE family protein [Sinorhizobium garamanticum]